MNSVCVESVKIDAYLWVIFLSVSAHMCPCFYLPGVYKMLNISFVNLPLLCHVMSLHYFSSMVLLWYAAGPYVKQFLYDKLNII